MPDLTVDLSAPARAYDNLGQRMFVRFKRLLSAPRTDGNSQQVFFRRDESFALASILPCARAAHHIDY